MPHDQNAPTENPPHDAVVMRLAKALVAGLASPTAQRTTTSASASDVHQLLTLEEAATMMRVSRMTVDRAIKSGEFPVVQFRRTYRVPRAFVEYVISEATSGKQVIVEDYAARWIADQETKVAV